MTPEICPHCGAGVPPKAKACPQCGADELTGWSDSAHASNLGLPDEDFDYAGFVQAEFGDKSPKPRGLHWFWWLTALLLILLFLVFCFH